MEIKEILKLEFGLKAEHVENIINLLDEGCTIPFIARYRKEATNGLDETKIKKISDIYEYQVNL